VAADQIVHRADVASIRRESERGVFWTLVCS